MNTKPHVPDRATGGLLSDAPTQARRALGAFVGLAAGAVLASYGLALALLGAPLTGPARVGALDAVLTSTVLALAALLAAMHTFTPLAARRPAHVLLPPEDAPW